MNLIEYNSQIITVLKFMIPAYLLINILLGIGAIISPKKVIKKENDSVKAGVIVFLIIFVLALWNVIVSAKPFSELNFLNINDVTFLAALTVLGPCIRIFLENFEFIKNELKKK